MGLFLDEDGEAFDSAGSSPSGKPTLLPGGACYRPQAGEPPKNKLARFVAMPGELTEALREWMLKTGGQHLIPDLRGGILSNKVLNRWHRLLAEAAEMPVITSHGARHTTASSYARRGQPEHDCAVSRTCRYPRHRPIHAHSNGGDAEPSGD